MRKLRERYQGQEVSTRDFQQVLEEELPEALRYEGKKSLDWFFEGWVNGSAIPKLQLKDVRFRRQPAGATASGVLSVSPPFIARTGFAPRAAPPNTVTVGLAASRLGTRKSQESVPLACRQMM